MNRTINEVKSSHLLNEKIANDLLKSEAKTQQFNPKFRKRETLVDKWSVQLIAILQKFQNTLITRSSHM